MRQRFRLFGTNMDGVGCLVAESDFHSVDEVDGWVAGWSAAQSGDEHIGDETHVHEMVLYGLREVKRNQDAACSDLQLT